MKTIFIVDDNDTNLISAKTALDGAYRTFAMPSAERMFKMLERKTPDLIFLDVNMPEMNGFQALEKMKSDENLRGIPVVFLSAKHDEASEKRGLEMGARMFVKKPFSAEELIECIETYGRAD